MLKSSLRLSLCAAVLALGACGPGETGNEAARVEGEAGAEQTIVQSLDENSRFFQAARAVGLDATLGGAGPYTVMVPSDEAFAGIEDSLAGPADPQNRAATTRILTNHILPGVILAEDISNAIDNGEGRAVLATMGGETLTATKENGTIRFAGSGGGTATLGEADHRASNGVIHHIDAVLMPSAGGEGSGDQ